jgi:hypothetical protein
MIQHQKVGARAACMMAVALLAGGALACGNRAIQGCTTDSQCALGRTCVNGECQYATAGTGGTGGGNGGTGGAGGNVSTTRTWDVGETVNRDVDILMMIDNSRSMLPLQNKLLTNFPVFTQTLESLPDGLPNLHLAIVSSDMGAGRNTIQLCNNDQGIFQAIPRGTCTATNLMPGQNFISNVNGVANYTGAIEDVFTCIAALGQDGCGFEAQLNSVVRALGADGYTPPPENTGFLRTNAYLAIVLFTNEDDCSVPADSDLFDTNSRLVSDPLGPLQSFRCNEYGHLCGTPPAPPSRTVAADYQNCVPAEDKGQLIPVYTFADQIKALKADPNKIMVAAIAGLPTPYHVSLAAPLIAQDPQMWPQIDHSCMENSGEFADPGVRLAAFTQAFGANGLYLTTCAPSFAPALQQIAQKIGALMDKGCLQGPFALDANGRPDCAVTQQTFTASGSVTSMVIPDCDTTAATPCWKLTSDPLCAGGSRFQAVGGGTLSAGVSYQISCAVTN